MGGTGFRTSTRVARICISGILVLAGLAGIRPAPAAAQSPPAGPSWPKARFDTANTAFNTSESWLSTGNVASSALDWSTRINPRESPLVAGGVIYAGCEGDSFCALDAATGSVRWKTVVGAPNPSRTSALVGASSTRQAARMPTRRASGVPC